MKIEVIDGNLLDKDVEVIVNTWNQNIIPWWLLIPQRFSGAIKKHVGVQPFRELSKFGAIPLGNAVLTNAGKLTFKGIIHVAGINMLWMASKKSIRDCIKNTMEIVKKDDFNSIAFPLIGAGSCSFNTESAKLIILDEFKHIESTIKVILVEYKKND